MEYSIIDIRTIGTTDRGQLSFFEAERDVPFEIKRIYYIYDAPQDVERGGHAHRNLSQVLWCPYGEIEILLDDGNTRKSILLDDPTKGLVISDLIWREMVWKQKGSVLAVAASAYYDEKDYIRNYDQFMQEITTQQSSAGGAAQ